MLKNDQQYADAAGSLIANCFVSICEVRRSEPAADVADSVQHVPAPPVMIHKDVQTLGWDNSAAERDIQNANELGPISEKQRKVILGTVLLVVVKLLTRLRELHEKKGGRLFLYPDNNQSVVSILAKPLKADKLVMTTVSIPPSGDSILLTRKNNVDALKRGYRAQVERLVTSYKATVGNNNCNSRPTIQQTKKQTLQDKSTVISQQKAREKLSVAMPRRINLLDLQKSAAADNKKVPAEIKPRVTKSNLISSNFVTRPFVSTYRQNMMTEPVEKPNEAGRKRSSISSGGGSLQELPMDDDSEKNPVNSNEGNPSMAVKFHANIISNNGLGVVPNKHNNLSSIVTSENSQQNTLLKSGMRNPSQSKSSISKSAAEEEDETSTQSSSRKTFPHSATVSSSSSVSEKSAVESQRTTSSSSSTTTTRSGSSSSSMSSAADGKSSADSSNKTKSSKSEDKSQGEKSSRSESSTENEHVGSGKISSQSTASSVHSDIKCSLRGSAAGAFTSGDFQ